MCFVCAFGEPTRNLPQQAKEMNYDDKKALLAPFL